MASQPKIEVAISAKADQLSASLAKVRREIAGLPALAQQASQKTGGTDLFGGGRLNGSMLGLDRVEKQVGRLHSAARMGIGGVGSIAGMIPGLGLVAGAASVGGLASMVSSMASAGVELTNTSRLAGTTAAGLNSMRGAARLMGLSAETADGAMLGLNHTIQDAVYGKNADALNYFKLAGIDIGSIATGAKSAEAVLPKVVDSLSKAAKTNPLAAEQLAQIWGVPSAALPMLIKGRDALQANRQEVERIYGSFDAYTAASEKYTYATGRMSLASDKLGMSISTALSPALTPMLLDLSKWVDKHNDDIADTFGKIGKAALGVHWSDVGDGIDKVGKALSSAAASAGDFADRTNRAFETMKGIKNFAMAPGLSFQDWLHGRAPTDSGVDVQLSPQQRKLLEQAGNDQMRAGTLPGPEEGMPVSPGLSGKGATALPAAEKERRGRAARDQLVSLGWSPRQAAGIVANLYSGSGMDAGAVGDNGQAGGLAQWHNERRQAIRRQFGKSVENMSVEEQIRAVDWELRNTEKTAGDALRRTTTAAEAGDVVSRQYERPGAADVEASVRARSADAFDRRWSSGGPARSPQLTMPDASQAAGANGGNLQITIDHQNVPAGVTMTPKLQSNSAEIAGINVKRAMPHAGKMPLWGWPTD